MNDESGQEESQGELRRRIEQRLRVPPTRDLVSISQTDLERIRRDIGKMAAGVDWWQTAGSVALGGAISVFTAAASVTTGGLVWAVAGIGLILSGGVLLAAAELQRRHHSRSASEILSDLDICTGTTAEPMYAAPVATPHLELERQGSATLPAESRIESDPIAAGRRKLLSRLVRREKTILFLLLEGSRRALQLQEISDFMEFVQNSTKAEVQDAIGHLTRHDVLETLRSGLRGPVSFVLAEWVYDLVEADGEAAYGLEEIRAEIAARLPDGPDEDGPVNAEKIP